MTTYEIVTTAAGALIRNVTTGNYVTRGNQAAWSGTPEQAAAFITTFLS